MNKKTLKALQRSIKKWEDIVKGTGIDFGEDNCPLCRLILPISDTCQKCSVYLKTKKVQCYRSPYKEWIEHHKYEHGQDIWNLNFKIECPKCKKIAQKELDFLKSLLPKTKGKF